MIGTISSLGIGSGVLSSDLIEKLKQNDEDLLITPLNKKLDLTKQSETALTEFQTLLSNLKSKTLDFSTGDILEKRNTNIIGDSVSINVNNGVDIQDFDINVKQLAQNDIYQSKGFDTQESIINNSGDKQILTLNYNNENYKIELEDNATLEDLKNNINNLNSGIEASIIDTGNDYKLILKGNETGEDNIIKFNYDNIDNLGFNNTIYQSKKYDNDTDLVNDSGEEQTFKISINDIEYSMSLEDGTSVKDMIDKINNGDLKDNEGNSLKGITSKYEDGYIKFDLQSIGDISIIDNNLTTEFNNNTNFENNNRLQKAQNSLFEYNGIDIERTTNELKDDLIIGTTINLQNIGNTKISITQDTNNIKEELKQFISDYNNVISNLQNLTKNDKDNNTIGLFNSNNNFTKIESDLYNSIFNNNEAVDLGFSYDKNGYISLDDTKINENNIDNLEDIFSNLNNSLKNISNNLDIYNNELKNEEDDYEERLLSMNNYLENKYDSLTQQFISYDSIINNYNLQSNIIQSMIEQQLNNK